MPRSGLASGAGRQSPSVLLVIRPLDLAGLHCAPIIGKRINYPKRFFAETWSHTTLLLACSVGCEDESKGFEPSNPVPQTGWWEKGQFAKASHHVISFAARACAPTRTPSMTNIDRQSVDVGCCNNVGTHRITEVCSAQPFGETCWASRASAKGLRLHHKCTNTAPAQLMGRSFKGGNLLKCSCVPARVMC